MDMAELVLKCASWLVTFYLLFGLEDTTFLACFIDCLLRLCLLFEVGSFVIIVVV